MCVWPRGQVHQGTVGVFILIVTHIQSAAVVNKEVCDLKEFSAFKKKRMFYIEFPDAYYANKVCID